MPKIEQTEEMCKRKNNKRKKMKKKLLQMFKLQQELNDTTNGIGWERGTTKEDRVINWNRCIYMETAEFIDSFNWKHWKNINEEPDLANARIELVDIWHFLMSEKIRDYKLIHSTQEPELFEIDVIDNFGDFMIEHLDGKDKNSNGVIIEIAEEFLSITLKPVRINYLIKGFVMLCKSTGLSFDDLYKLYMAKNVLNIFRQENGYKEGEYIKMWDLTGTEDYPYREGELLEDNVVLKMILDTGNFNTKEELLAELENVYRQDTVDEK